MQSVFLHVDGRRLTGGADAVVPAHLQHHVGEPHGRLARRVAQTGQEHAAETAERDALSKLAWENVSKATLQQCLE